MAPPSVRHAASLAIARSRRSADASSERTSLAPEAMRGGRPRGRLCPPLDRRAGANTDKWTRILVPMSLTPARVAPKLRDNAHRNSGLSYP
jgi:hypothetical protein